MIKEKNAIHDLERMISYVQGQIEKADKYFSISGFDKTDLNQQKNELVQQMNE